MILNLSGKSTKPVNQYLCSIPKYIEGADAECLADIINDVRDSVQQNIAKIQPDIRVELEEELKKFHKLFIDKLEKLSKINSDD